MMFSSLTYAPLAGDNKRLFRLLTSVLRPLPSVPCPLISDLQRLLL
jgi:hypothetical protein